MPETKNRPQRSQRCERWRLTGAAPGGKVYGRGLTRTLCLRILQFAKQFASGKPVQMHVQLPLLKPNSDMDLQRFEKRHQVLDSYLWLARRFPGRFLDAYAERAVHVLMMLGAIVTRMCLF